MKDKWNIHISTYQGSTSLISVVDFALQIYAL